MWQQFIRLLANHPEAVDRLANSYVIRRMAQLTHYIYLRLADGVPSDRRGRLSSFAKQFGENIKKEIESSKQSWPKD
jgi:hypothetical protein